MTTQSVLSDGSTRSGYENMVLRVSHRLLRLPIELRCPSSILGDRRPCRDVAGCINCKRQTTALAIYMKRAICFFE